MLSAMIGSQLFVNLIAGGLILFGLGLLSATIIFWRSAHPDPELLGPLEIMYDRKFARADEQERLALLNQYRPLDADPIIESQAPTVLSREPDSEPSKEVLDPFSHDDDAVDVIQNPSVVPDLIDPLIHQFHKDGGSKNVNI
ncbi:MAG: hypothetical protein NTU52_02850 [Actinobacteria bacterium]|nr:hypothetical protein [Actinomycetota bacterium]